MADFERSVPVPLVKAAPDIFQGACLSEVAKVGNIETELIVEAGQGDQQNLFDVAPQGVGRAHANNRGFLHLKLGLYILAAIAVWFLYNSYQRQQLRGDLEAMIADVQQIASHVSAQSDRAKLEEAISSIRDVATRNSIDISSIKNFGR